MGTSYSQGGQSAAAFGEAFVAGNLYAASVTGTTGQATLVSPASTVTGFVPDFVIGHGLLTAERTGGDITINGTTGVVTWTRDTTAAPITISYILGNLE